MIKVRCAFQILVNKKNFNAKDQRNENLIYHFLFFNIFEEKRKKQTKRSATCEFMLYMPATVRTTPRQSQEPKTHFCIYAFQINKQILKVSQQESLGSDGFTYAFHKTFKEELNPWGWCCGIQVKPPPERPASHIDTSLSPDCSTFDPAPY